jgi:NAD(P)-dependent dehydrogenase (short-subunit alcohol dehydrogenase family)
LNTEPPSKDRKHPAGRAGKPEEIARVCLSLTDPANHFITGSPSPAA